MKELFKKYREIIVYIIVGLMTTVVSYGIRLGVIYGFAPVLGGHDKSDVLQFQHSKNSLAYT